MDKDQTINFNHNAAECLQKTNGLGSTTIQNICNGKTFVVPWGGADWFGALAMFMIAALFVVLIGGFAKMLWYD